MKRLMAVVLLVLAMGIVSGCGPKKKTTIKTERAARREERRDLAVRREWEGIPDDWESIWLYGQPMRLGRWEGH